MTITESEKQTRLQSDSSDLLQIPTSEHKRNHALVRQGAMVQLLLTGKCDEHQNEFLRQGLQDLDNCAI